MCYDQPYQMVTGPLCPQRPGRDKDEGKGKGTSWETRTAVQVEGPWCCSRTMAVEDRRSAQKGT